MAAAPDAHQSAARLPSIGAAVGAAIIVGYAIAEVAFYGYSVASLVMLSVLLPLFGRWPLSRARVVWTAGLWVIVGCLAAWAGGGYVAIAALPAMTLSLAGWGARPHAPEERRPVSAVVIGLALLTALPVLFGMVMLLAP